MSSILINGNGQRIVANGRVLRGNSGDLCCCSPTVLCTTENTCNQPCNPQYKAFDNPIQCGCPCPGGLDYYPLRSFTWTSIRVDTTGSYVDIDSPPDHFRIAGADRITITGIISNSGGGTSCDDQPSSGFPAGCDYDFNNDGDFADPGEIWDGMGNGFGVNGGFSISGTLSTCGDQIRYQGQWSCVANNPATSSLDGNIIATFDTGWWDRCTGRITATPVAGAYVPWVLNAGIITFDTTCHDCSGAIPVFGTEPAQRCSREFDIYINLPDDVGGAYRLHRYRMYFDGVDSWFGSDQFGFAASVVPASANPDDSSVNCCPEKNIINPATGSPYCTNCRCNGCWIATLHSDTPDLGFWNGKYFNTNDSGCPGGFWSKITPTAYDIDSAGFVEGC